MMFRAGRAGRAAVNSVRIRAAHLGEMPLFAIHVSQKVVQPKAILDSEL